MDSETIRELNAQVNEYAAKKLAEPKVLIVTPEIAEAVAELVNA